MSDGGGAGIRDHDIFPSEWQGRPSGARAAVLKRGG